MAKLLPETGDVLAVPLATAMGVTCVGGAGLTKPPAGTGSAVTTAVCYVPHTHTHTLCNKRQYSRLNRRKLMSPCRRSAGRLFHRFGPAAAKHLSAVAVGPSHNTCPRCGRMQLTTTFVGGQLKVGGQIGWSHDGHWQVDQGGYLEIHLYATMWHFLAEC